MISIRRRIFSEAFSTMPMIKYSAGPSDEFHLKIGNYQIHFPYKPYECQREYMEKVIYSLESGTNAALESPTGTGKTLSLLCSTIEWVLRQNEMPKIYYASRTHHQLKQVIKELNKTKYKNMIKVATLASRDHLCLLQSVLEESNKTETCQAKIRDRMCPYFRHLDMFLKTNHPNKFHSKYLMANKALDLNDVKELAQQNNHCPFYVARGMGKFAQLIFLPYNYLIDPEIRERFSVDLLGNILIFDEAHNLESISERAMSMQFSTKILQKAINELWEVIKLKEKSKINSEEDRKLYGQMKELNGQINAMDLEKEGIRISTKLQGRAFPANKLIELLKASGIDNLNCQQICGLINSICISFLSVQIERNNFSQNGGGFKLPIPRGIYLTCFGVFLQRIFINIKDQDASSLNNHYKLYIEEKLSDEGEREEILLNYWCFNAAIAMHFLESFGTHSILFTSGTLAPLDTFMATMGIKFGQKLESPHCAHRNNLMLKIVQNGPNNIPLLGTFKNRNSFNYKQSISELLFKLARITPQGMLVFFPSYWQMNNFIEHLKDTKMCNGRQIWAELNRQKRIFFEPRDKADILQLFNNFDKAVRTNPNGAILFSVCRGKLSEGIDFADSHCRSVVIVGIPFPPCYDPRVMLKKEYLIEQNKRAKNTNKMGPNEWYKNEATRAVNQAIGRVIRHKNDFGTVILADSRYARMSRQAFPLWIRPSIEKTHPASFNSILPSIQQFFMEKGISMKHSMHLEKKRAVI